MPDREKVIRGLESCAKGSLSYCEECPYTGMGCSDHLCADALALLREQEAITGETSDGYHTFNELYHHRAVLFSVIVRDHKDLAWKARKHHDGTMYDGMFIVGIETPDGQATYHYDLDPYWDVFECRELECAPEWDGHTPTQAIERIGRLRLQEPRVMTLEEVRDSDDWMWIEYLSGYVEWQKQSDIFGYYEDGVMWNDSTFDGNDSYGIEWRCWTSRPSEQQMRETKWEGESE